MYSSLPDDVRDAHPYFMYEEIREQPEAVRRSLEIVASEGAAVAALLARARRVLVTGCGTSFHAAQCGAHFLRWFTSGQLDARAVQAYELVTYAPALRPDDVVIGVTHSGSTTMTLAAMRRAQEAGAETVAVTGFPESAVGDVASGILPTGYQDERSWAHTISYLAAITTLAAL